MAKMNLSRICKLIDIATDDKSVANNFLTDLSYAICKYDEINKPIAVSKSYKPSSLNCIRNMYYQVIGQPLDNTSQTSYEFIGICESGTARHNDLQNAIIHMKDVGIDCEYVNVADFVKNRNLSDIEIIEQCGNETKLYNSKHNMRFLCDGIIKYKGNYYILEIKTEASFKWEKRTDVDEQHKLQAIAYSLSLGLNNVIFLYENRNLCAKKCYLFEVTNDMKDKLIQKILTCNICVSHKKAPDRPFPDFTNKNCKYCDYIQQCKLEG